MPGQSRRHTSSGTAPSGGASRNQQGSGRGNAAAAAEVPQRSEPNFFQRLFGMGGGNQQAARAQVVAPAAWMAVVNGQTLLRRGARGEAVQHLQQQLVASGAQITVDGIFGPGTERAVRSYQRSRGLQVDGVVGRGTAGSFDGSVARAPQDPGREARDAAVSGGTPDRNQGSRSSSSGGPRLGVNPNSFRRAGLRPEVFSVAIDVFRNAWSKGDTQKMTYTVIDYSLPSTEKRMWVIDMERGRLLYHELVTHGARSGGNMMTSHSNTVGSNQTSIGLSRTAETYYSNKFKSTALRIDGLESGYNDNMRRRAVVMHAANYATPEAIAANGGARLGRSQGCPAIDPRVSGEIIDTVKNGTLIFSYYPDPRYMQNSNYVNG